MELSATEWLFDNTLGNSASGDYEIKSNIYTCIPHSKRFFSQSEYSDKSMMKDKKVIYQRTLGMICENTLYDVLYGHRTLILTGKKDLIFRDAFPENVRMKFQRIYDPEDFIRLGQDPTVNCIYRSEECSVYLISNSDDKAGSFGNL